jgi:hypothetical protein
MYDTTTTAPFPPDASSLFQALCIDIIRECAAVTTGLDGVSMVIEHMWDALEDVERSEWEMCYKDVCARLSAAACVSTQQGTTANGAVMIHKTLNELADDISKYDLDTKRKRRRRPGEGTRKRIKREMALAVEGRPL